MRILSECFAKEEYITGVIIVDMIGIQGIKFDDVRITLKGLEYLSENSLMKKAANLAKSIKETIPVYKLNIH